MTRNTSAEAYAAIMANGRISECRKRVYEYLYNHGPRSRNDIDRALSNGEPNPPYSRRLVEMERMGILARTGTAKADGGLASDLWDVTDKLPQELPKRKDARTPARAFKEIAELLLSPRAKTFPDSTLESAISIVRSVRGREAA